MPTADQLRALYEQSTATTPSDNRAQQLRSLYDQAGASSASPSMQETEPESDVPQSKLAFRIPQKALDRYKQQVANMPDGEEKKFHSKNYQQMSMYMDDLVQMENRAQKAGLSPEEQRIADTIKKENEGKLGVMGGSGTVTPFGTVGERGFARGAAKLGLTLQNVALRTMGTLGVSGASEAADNNNRMSALMTRLDQAQDKESALAEMTSPTVAKGVSAISEILPSMVVGGGGARALGFTGKMAETKALATLYGASGFDQGMTAAKDAGYGRVGQIGYATGMAALEAGIMLSFGKFAQAVGLESAEQVLFPSAKRAAEKLLTKTGIKELMLKGGKSVAGSTLEAGEESLTSVSQQLWGALYGTDKIDNLKGRAIEAALLGAATRSALGATQGLQTKLAEAFAKAPSYFAAATDADAFVKNADGEAIAAELTKTPEDLGMTPDATEVYKDEIRAQTDPAAEEEATPAGPPAGQPAAGRPPMPGEPQASAEGPPLPPGAPPAAAGPPAGPPSAAMPPQAPGGEAQPFNYTSARKVDIAADRKILGLDIPPSPTRRAWQESLTLAQEQGLDDVSTAGDLASQIMASPRSLDDVETAGLTMARASLKKQYAATAQAAAQEGADLTSIAALQTRIEQQYDMLSRAQLLSGTEKGRALAAQKLTVGMDMDLLSITGRARAAKKAPLTDKEKKQFENDVSGLAVKETDLDNAIQKQMGETAEAALKTAAEKSTTQDINDLYSRLNTLLGEGCAT